MTRGFLLGKFLPPHAGHLHLCSTAAQLVDELTVLVCTLAHDPIPGELRFRWMRELLPRARVVHFAEDVPQEPAEHPDFWTIWTGICRRAHPEPIDCVFGSEDYVVRLARELGAKPLILDPERLAFSISARQILGDPQAYWAMIPPPVRPYFQMRVCLIGPESTGKTTLARDLARHYRTLAVPEYGRVYDAGKRGEPWRREDFDEISRVHRAARASIAAAAGPILIEDTDPLLTGVWMEMLIGTPGPAVRDLAGLYLLLDTDVPWQDDGTRYFGAPADRARFAAACKAALEREGGRYRLIRGAGPARLQACIAAVEAFRR